MLLFPFEPRRLALLRHACCLATLALSVVLIGWSSASLAQTPSAAEEAIKKAIQAGQLDQANWFKKSARTHPKPCNGSSWRA
jgi:hypothetical protein